MKDDSCVVDIPPDLRERAVASVTAEMSNIEGMSPDEIRALVHDLRVSMVERDLLNEALHQSCERQAIRIREANSLLENSPDVIVRYDRELRIRYANPAFEQVTGVSEQRAIGHTFTELEFPEDRVELWETALRKVFETGMEATIEFDYAGSQGNRSYHTRIVPEHTNGQPLETALALSHDVSDLKQIEEALRSSEERYRIVSDLVSDYAYSYRSGVRGTFTLEWISGAFQRITGYTPEEANAWGDWSRLVHPDDRDLNRQRLETLRAGKEDATKHRIITRTGEVRWVRDYGRPILDEHGSVVRIVGATTDITDRILVEEEMEWISRFPEEDPYPVMRVSSEGEVLYANSASSVLLEHWQILSGESIPEPWQEVIREVFQSGADRTGEVVCCDRVFSVTIAFVPGANYVNLYASDITERKRAEEALRESEERYRTLFTNMSEGFAIGEPILDETGAPRDIRFLEVNDAFIRQTGLDRDITGRPLTEALPNLERYWVDNYGNVALTGKPMRFTEYNRDTGRYYDVYCYQPSVGRFAITFRDVTREREAEEILRESESRFRQLAESMPQLVWTANPYGRVNYYNDRRKAYGGISPDAEGGFNWGPALHPDDIEATMAAWRHALETGETYQIEHRVRMADGEYRWHLSRGEPVRDERGAIVKWYGTATDIHDTITAQQKLRESEELLRLIVESSPDVIFFKDRELRYTWIANPMVPTAGERVIGKTLAELPHFLDSEKLMDIERSVIETGKAVNADVRILINDEVRWFEDVFLPRRDESGNIIGLFGYARDITDRKRAGEKAQEILHLAERRAAELNAVFDAMPDAVYIGTAEGITRANTRALRMLGARSLEDLQTRIGELGKRFAVRWPDTGQLLREDELQFTRALKGETVIEDVLATNAETGEDIYIRSACAPIFEDGKVVAAVAVNSDITERKRAEDALRESEEDLNRAQAVANIGSWRLDTRRNELRWSAETYRIFGIPQGTRMGYESFLETTHPEDREYVDRKWAAALLGEPYDIEHRIIIGDTIKWVREKAELEFDREGNLRGGFGTVQDITERKEAENRITGYAERLRRQTAQLAAANKELEAFSYSVSHDLRAPLRSIDGFSLALLEDFSGKLGAEGDDYLNRIRAAAQRMARLIEDLLQLSRTTRAEFHYSSVDLSAQAQSVIEELRTAEPGRDVETVIQEGLVAEGDETLLRQVLQNLLGNAWKFTSHRESARIEFGEMREDGRRVFFVRDNGAGFDMKYADNLFTPFRRLHSESEFPGTGIGLSLVKRIILRHGGDIRAESEPGMGATFFFTLGED